MACNRRSWPRCVTGRLVCGAARLCAPSPRLATDNAAMVARAGLFHLERGDTADLDLTAYASRPIPGLVG